MASLAKPDSPGITAYMKNVARMAGSTLVMAVGLGSPVWARLPLLRPNPRPSRPTGGALVRGGCQAGAPTGTRRAATTRTI